VVQRLFEKGLRLTQRAQRLVLVVLSFRQLVVLLEIVQVELLLRRGQTRE
jgi:hypothetical protein